MSEISVQEYYNQAPEEHRETMQRLRDLFNSNLPEGFVEEMSYGFPSWVVPLATYPEGYHCGKELPLPMLSIATKKKFVAIYHMGLYANQELFDWFHSEYLKIGFKHKIDAGKSCIRFKYFDEVPYDLLTELARKISVNDYIAMYESAFKKK